MKRVLMLLMLVTYPAISQTMAQTDLSITKPDDERLYHTPEVDVKPELKNGMYTLSMFISKNFKMPDVQNKKVKLFVGFVVEPSGSITDIKFIYMTAKTIDESKPALSEEQKQYETDQLDTMKAESVRVLSQFTEVWKPAMKDGKAVRCQYNYPINFTLE
ncbi:MAG: hypothetical protein EOO50_13495 [Flavobacterium sp.]|uniref:hypothetical protein n=1 Tax=Flavobacterium sp. TaxID=239 RepID=UPI0011F4323A|nr:hypothetical protein [Flavobacterium sp.]RZJ65472.1 MAG: hypothetical protein EOO50_13495 [Flavobacterium sp.]